ncbi:hypothetical protein AA103196_1356 [Ameyamaea chiangmaiensis NBRC 103196]|uniref:Uncharacterized protein n=1 Tax=Ameyamaea chiangmaiensis TaxID=442969 RepID=A0A850PBC5_9PROT|nr:hypothetical protein [Ameyamaea chiangmaiensis]MBS4075178.1 hypothetical protein [Ameyamaea chiangmaiensis]NVN41845.1 hypothetical protein [Ameyamaea chiangmaiensis]GBQ66320.1 hypothetical protein AA103196_1356 [Ameyamaea chiangmaiensis NBRC 103196]
MARSRKAFIRLSVFAGATLAGFGLMILAWLAYIAGHASAPFLLVAGLIVCGVGFVALLSGQRHAYGTDVDDMDGG